MGSTNMAILRGVFRYLKDEYRRISSGEELDGRGWKWRKYPKNLPQQNNTNDCGVYVCMFADFLSQDLPLLFSQQEIGVCRERIAVAILESRNRN